MQKVLLTRALLYGSVLLEVNPLRGLDSEMEKYYLEKILESEHNDKILEIRRNLLRRK